MIYRKYIKLRNDIRKFSLNCNLSTQELFHNILQETRFLLQSCKRLKKNTELLLITETSLDFKGIVVLLRRVQYNNINA